LPLEQFPFPLRDHVSWYFHLSTALGHSHSPLSRIHHTHPTRNIHTHGTHQICSSRKLPNTNSNEFCMLSRADLPNLVCVCVCLCTVCLCLCTCVCVCVRATRVCVCVSVYVYPRRRSRPNIPTLLVEANTLN
jgi:hypothetical protein